MSIYFFPNDGLVMLFSLLHQLDVFAEYGIVFTKINHHYIVFQFEIVFTDIRIFLTSKGVGFCRKTNSSI